MKRHVEPPEGTQHYSSLATVYRKATDSHELFLFEMPTRRRRGDTVSLLDCGRLVRASEFMERCAWIHLFARVLRVCSNDREHFSGAVRHAERSYHDA